jgi:DHA1 family multidrug resistance protein-like MFS transporter
MLGWFIWEPIMGVFTDRFNKKLMLAGSILLTTILYSLYPLADTFLFFVVLEFAKTSILSAYSIPVKALVAELLPVEGRGRAYGRYTMVISLGGILSPLIGGYLSEVAGYSLPFYLAAVTGLIGIVAVLNIQYESTVAESKEMEKGGIKKLLNGPILTIFSIRGLFFFNAGFAGSFLSIYLNESPQFMASESQIGAFFTILRLTGASSRSVIGDICDRLGKKLLISTSLAGMGFSYILLTISSGIIPIYVIGALQGIFQAAADTSMMLHLITIMPKERSGLTMGLYSESENIGGLISTPTMGFLYQNYGNNSSVILLAAVLLLNAFYSYFTVTEKPISQKISNI